MKTSDLLAARQPKWQELEQLCGRLEGTGARKAPAAMLAHFAALYRSACADLALVDAYQLTPETIRYLHQLVGRAHNQLYRSQGFRLTGWIREVLVDVPRRLYADNCLRLAMVIFWGIFLAAMLLAWHTPEFADRVVGKEFLTQVEDMHAHSVSGRDTEAGMGAAGFYIQHNSSIGLRCLAFGLFLGIGGLFETVQNAAILGAVFGHMATTPQAENFFEFVTAHGPFELTAIVLMAAAGMRLGFSLVDTRGRTRTDALRRAARRCVPVMSTGVILFFLAAGIEAFVSPMDIPYAVKAGVAVASALLLLAYFIGLGYPGERDAG